MRPFNLRCAAALASIAAAACVACAEPTPPPNLVLIVADDLGYGDLGAYGNPSVRTPHLDRLADEGVRLSQGYVSAPLCAPTRAGLLTGRDANRFGYTGLTGSYHDQIRSGSGVPLSETLLPETLRRAGYATGAVGKWHLGVSPRFRPRARGFDSFFGVLAGAHRYFDWGGGLFGPVFRDDAPARGDGYLTHAFADEAARFIESHREEPFFLYVAFTAVHPPLEVPEHYLEQHAHLEGEQRALAAMIASLDDAVGTILAALDATGTAERSLVIFLSDNGGLEGLSWNGPLRGGKGSLLEGGIRVPFILRWPGVLPAGVVHAEPASSLDVFPTLLAAAGAAPPPRPLDGVSLLPQLTGRGPASAGRSLYWRSGDQLAIRRGPLKLVRYATPPQTDLQGFALYDLGRDPGESRDLSAERAAEASRLRAELEVWSARLPASSG